MKSNGEHEKERKWQVTQQVASNLIVVAGGIVLYLTLNNLDVVKDVVGELISILSPFMAGLVLAYLLDGLARFFQQKLLGGKHRTFAVILAYMVTLLLLGLLLRIVLPQVVQSITVLVNRVPEYLRSLNTLVKDLSEQYGLDAKGLEALVGSYQDLIRKATDIVSNLLPQLVSYSAAIGSGVVSALTAVISSLYMMLSKETLLRQIRKLIWALMPEKAARRTLDICHKANAIFSGFINGKIIDSVIIGLLCYVGTSILRMPFAVLISVIVGVTNVIPFFGPFIGAIPSTMILLIFSPLSALEFVIFVLALQQFDGNVLGPRILGDSTGLSPLWVLVSIIVGSGLFGFAGMLVGVPTFAVLYTLLREYLNDRLAQKGIDEAGNPVAAAPEPQTLAENEKPCAEK